MQGKTKRDMIVQQVRKEAGRNKMIKAVGMSYEGNWTMWETGDKKSLSLKDLWSMDQGKPNFLLGCGKNLTYSTPPTNLGS